MWLKLPLHTDTDDNLNYKIKVSLYEHLNRNLTDNNQNLSYELQITYISAIYIFYSMNGLHILNMCNPRIPDIVI